MDDEDELLYGDSESSVFDSSVNTSMKEDSKAGYSIYSRLSLSGSLSLSRNRRDPLKHLEISVL